MRKRMPGRSQYAYRVVYELLIGPIPPEHVAHHVCEHEWCVNPWHLEILTRSAHRKIHGFPEGGRANAAKTHCAQGHPFDADNTIWQLQKRAGRNPSMRRLCRECKNAWKRDRYAGRK